MGQGVVYASFWPNIEGLRQGDNENYEKIIHSTADQALQNEQIGKDNGGVNKREQGKGSRCTDSEGEAAQ